MRENCYPKGLSALQFLTQAVCLTDPFFVITLSLYIKYFYVLLNSTCLFPTFILSWQSQKSKQVHTWTRGESKWFNSEYKKKKKILRLHLHFKKKNKCFRDNRYLVIWRWARWLLSTTEEKKVTKPLAEENSANSKYFCGNEVYETQRVRWHNLRQQQLGQVQSLTSQGREVFWITMKQIIQLIVQ